MLEINNISATKINQFTENSNWILPSVEFPRVEINQQKRDLMK